MKLALGNELRALSNSIKLTTNSLQQKNKPMKKLLLISTLLFLCGMMSFAQNDYSVVKGNVAEKNVNISIINTDFGVSSDNKGDFIMMLPKMEKQVGLLFSCIGYEDTLVSVMPNRDTIEINFKMKEVYYMLDAVGVSAAKVTKYDDDNYVMIDFEIADDKFYILQRKEKTTKDFRILVTDMFFDPYDTIPLLDRIKPTNLFLDVVTQQCQIVGQDSVYVIFEQGERILYGYPVEMNYYMRVMKIYSFVTDNYVYYQKKKSKGYAIEFYRANVDTGENEMIFSSDDSYKLKEIKKEREFHSKNRIKVQVGADEVMELGPKPNEWENFISKAWYQSKNAYLGHVDDTLYYFNHLCGRIETYDEEMNLIRYCDITYPMRENFWRHTIYQDRAWGTFYTFFGTMLNEIDVINGRTTSKVNANSLLSRKMIIYKGNLYQLKRKRDTSNSEISYIERIKL